MRYVCLILLSAFSIAAGQSASVTGEVSSETSVDFTGMQAELQSATGLGSPPEHSDVGYDGRFEIRNVPDGEYNLTLKTSSGTTIYREVVRLTSFERRLTIRLRGERVQRPVSGLVSVQQLQHNPPKAARKAFEKGIRLYEKHDVEGSLASLQKAVELDPEYAQAFNNLGARYMMLGRLNESVAAFRRSVELDPYSSITHANLAQALISRGEPADAELAARRGVDLDRSDARGAYMLGLSLVLQRKYTPEAVSNLRRSESISPRARLALGLALANTGSTEDARQAFSACLQSQDGPVRAEAQRLLMRLR